jgi:hypothetical protein
LKFSLFTLDFKEWTSEVVEKGEKWKYHKPAVGVQRKSKVRTVRSAAFRATFSGIKVPAVKETIYQRSNRHHCRSTEQHI